MLTPEYLENCPDVLVELYAQVEIDIIADMGRKLSQYDYFVSSAEWQKVKAKEMGLMHEDIMKRLSAITGKSKAELKKLLKEAGIETLKTDDAIYKSAGLDPQPPSISPALSEALTTGLAITQGTFVNLTRTTALNGAKQFTAALDRAYMQIVSGAFDPNTAIRNAVKDLAEKGLEAIQYPARTDALDTAVRRAVRTGVSQTCGKLQEARAAEMGNDLVEVTAHSGARPSHAEWQGKIFSLSGKHPKYPSLREVTGYGTAGGLKGANCRHDFYPFIEGVSTPAYTESELAKMEEKKYEYRGKKMTEYEATQKQRYIERQIRRWKRENRAMKAAGLDTGEAAAKVRDWQGVQRDFLKQTGLKRQVDREYIGKIKMGGLASKQSDITRKNTPQFAGKIDISNHSIVQSKIKEFESEVVNEPIEHAYVILPNGKTYKFVGDKGSVNPEIMGSALKGAIITHNHPISETEYSFSNLDLQMFQNSGLSVLRGFDEKYIYELTRNSKDIEDEVTDWMNFENFQHSQIREKAAEYGIGYKRWGNEYKTSK